MLMTGFSVQGSSLKMLRSQERGVITRIKTLSEATAHKLRILGLTMGRSITVEQQFPRFIIRVGNESYALEEALVNSIYVRIVKH
jgi:Fe2+ transport system protein FeoA